MCVGVVGGMSDAPLLRSALTWSQLPSYHADARQTHTQTETSTKGTIKSRLHEKLKRKNDLTERSKQHFILISRADSRIGARPERGCDRGEVKQGPRGSGLGRGMVTQWSYWDELAGLGSCRSVKTSDELQLVEASNMR